MFFDPLYWEKGNRVFPAADCTVENATGYTGRLLRELVEEQGKTDGMLVKRPPVIGDGFVLVGFKEAEGSARLPP